MRCQLFLVIVLILTAKAKANEKYEADLSLSLRQIQNMKSMLFVSQKKESSLLCEKNKSLAQKNIQLALSLEEKEHWQQSLEKAIYQVSLFQGNSNKESNYLLKALEIIDRLKIYLSSEKAKSFLLTLENLNLTPSDKLAANFLSLRLARHFNFRHFIKEKINALKQESLKDPSQRILVLYYQSFLNLSLVEQAESLTRALDASPKNSPIRPTIALELATAQYKLRKFDIAAAHLEKIPKDNSLYLSKLNLAVLIALANQEFTKSHQYVLEILKNNDDDPNIYFIRKISPYLALLAKNPKQAKIEATKNIQLLKSEIQEVKASTLTNFSEIAAINKRLMKYNKQTPMLKKEFSIANLYKAASANLTKISNQEAKLSSAITTLINQQLTGDLFSYDKAIQKKAITTLLLMYEVIDQKISNQSLSINKDLSYASLRSKRYLRAKPIREKEEDKQFVHLILINNNLINGMLKWQETNAKALALKHFNQIANNQKTNISLLISSLNDALIKRENTFHLFREQQIILAINLAKKEDPLRLVRKHNQDLIFEDQFIRQENLASHFLAKEESKNYDKIWSLYEQLSHELEEISIAYRQTKVDVLKNFLERLQDIHARKIRAQSSLSKIAKDEEKTIEKTATSLRVSYALLLKEELSEQKKWLADANWLEYNSLDETSSKVTSHFRLQEQSLLDLKNVLIEKMSPL